MFYLILIFLSILGWGVGSVFYKIANENLHPVMVSAVVTMVYLVLTPLTFLVVKFDRSINLTGVVFSILGGCCMAVGSLGYFFALKKGDAGVVTAATSLYPALTLILSVFFMGEKLSIRTGIGIALALLSFVFLSQK